MPYGVTTDAMVGARTNSGLIAVAATLALAGCGSADERDEPAAPATRLTVSFDPGSGPLAGDGRRSSRAISCPGHTLCRRLAAVDPEAFEPVPGDVACTAIFGGPQTATVRGTLRGEEIDARFSRRNGCEISRWDELEWLLVPGPGTG